MASLPVTGAGKPRRPTRIGATPGMRLACQFRPTADISVRPLLSADAIASDGPMRAGMEGSERQVTVMFIDLRGSTTLASRRMPYDVLFDSQPVLSTR